MPFFTILARKFAKVTFLQWRYKVGNFFQSLNEILGDVECTTNQQLLEMAGLRLESAVGVLQQLVSLVPGESESGNILMTLLRNFRLL